MAESEEKKENQKEQVKTSGKIGILTWVIMFVIIMTLAGSGFVLGRLFAGNEKVAKEEPVKQEKAETEKHSESTKADGSEKSWYYNELESIVVNPDEPGATRFVRVGLILEMDSGLSEEKAKELIGAQKPLLVNWVNLYFKSLTLDQMRNDKDMKRIQLQILDAFNEILFSNGKPQIKKVLIKEFNIQ